MVLIKDPDTLISSGTAQLAEFIGENLDLIRNVAFYGAAILAFAWHVNQTKKCIKEDKKYGSCRRVVKRIVDFTITMLFVFGGCYIACLIEFMTGRRISSTQGSWIGGFLAQPVCELTVDPILDFFEIDAFEDRRFKKSDQKKCEKCGHLKID